MPDPALTDGSCGLEHTATQRVGLEWLLTMLQSLSIWLATAAVVCCNLIMLKYDRIAEISQCDNAILLLSASTHILVCMQHTCTIQVHVCVSASIVWLWHPI